ncbi:MAG: hypothetical protein ACRENU_03060 [Gemmatimonadaceae bacterium]
MTAPSLLILGTDAVLAAMPATPVQLAHACLAAGYDAAIPASWGDELIAAKVLDRLRDADTSLVLCSCPLVARRLRAAGPGLEPMLFSTVPPPVATALYLRSVYAPMHPIITFAGGCAAAGDESIDVWLSPESLFARLADLGISARTQPTEFDSILPPDRRRFLSDPGGVPSRAAMERSALSVERRDIGVDDVDVRIAQYLLSESRSLIDIAPSIGCRCSGATGLVPADIARARVRELEPPRSFAPVVDHSLPLGLEVEHRIGAENGAAGHAAGHRERAASPPSPSLPPASEVEPPPNSSFEATPPRRHSPPLRKTPQGLARPALVSMPHIQADGRQLPRAYVARRRSSPRNVRQVTDATQRVPEGVAPPNATPPKMKWIPVVAAGLTAGLILSWLILTL